MEEFGALAWAPRLPQRGENKAFVAQTPDFEFAGSLLHLEISAVTSLSGPHCPVRPAFQVEV